MITKPYVDLFTCPQNSNQAICINISATRYTTHKGIVLVRGLEAKADMLHHVSETLFDHAINNGHTPCDLGIKDNPLTGKIYRLLSFPVKNELRDPCDKKLIIDSAHKLVKIADTIKLEKIYLVRPGYGIDLPDYDTAIRPELHKIFDDRFYLLDYLLN